MPQYLGINEHMKLVLGSNIQEKAGVRYQVQVEGLLIAGHPVNNFFADLGLAAKCMDEYHEKYPYNTVRLFETVQKELKSFKAQLKPIPESCPKGHNGLADGKPNIVLASRGWYCKICGCQWEAA